MSCPPASPLCPGCPHLARPPRLVDSSGAEEAEALEAEVTRARRHLCCRKGLDPLAAGLKQQAEYYWFVSFLLPPVREKMRSMCSASGASVSASHSCLLATPKTSHPS